MWLSQLHISQVREEKVAEERSKRKGSKKHGEAEARKQKALRGVRATQDPPACGKGQGQQGPAGLVWLLGIGTGRCLLLQGFWGLGCQISVQAADVGLEHRGDMFQLLEPCRVFLLFLQEENEQQEPLQKRRGDEVKEREKTVLELKNLLEQKQLGQAKERCCPGAGNWPQPWGSSGCKCDVAPGLWGCLEVGGRSRRL